MRRLECGLRRVKLGMRLPHVGVIALVNQVFFGCDVIVEAGFGESKTTRDVCQRC